MSSGSASLTIPTSSENWAISTPSTVMLKRAGAIVSSESGRAFGMSPPPHQCRIEPGTKTVTLPVFIERRVTSCRARWIPGRAPARRHNGPIEASPKGSRWWVGTDDGDEPDYRFTLANERTFLAWVRTALGLLAGGVAVRQLVDPFDIANTTTALALISVGCSVVLVGRWISALGRRSAGDSAWRGPPRRSTGPAGGRSLRLHRCRCLRAGRRRMSERSEQSVASRMACRRSGRCWRGRVRCSSSPPLLR